MWARAVDLIYQVVAFEGNGAKISHKPNFKLGKYSIAMTTNKTRIVKDTDLD